MIEIIKNPNIDFVGKRKYAFMLSLVLVTLGIIAFVMISVGKANLGIDFAGGAMILGQFPESGFGKRYSFGFERRRIRRC
jgi:preprotein translocase subunit SecF